MADLNGGKGKFWNVAEGVDYAQSFVGATKVAEKIKKGGSETTPDGFVVDAIDIDWGGLSLTSLTNNSGTLTSTQISSTGQNAGKGENTEGIHSSAYMLSKISESFKAIVDIMGASSSDGLRGIVSGHTTSISDINTTIGSSDDEGLRKKIKDVETSLNALANLSPEELTRIQNDLAKIKAELDGDTTYNWATLVDKLAGLGDSTVKKYVDDQDAATLASAQTYADNKVADLDATVRGNLNDNDTIVSNKKVGIKVVETDGVLTGVSVVENDIASASELTTLSNTVSGHTTSISAINDKLAGIDGTVKDYVDAQDAATLASAQTYADNKVAALDATVDSTGGSYVAVQVVEENGIITGVTISESDIASAEALSTLKTTVDTKLAGLGENTVKKYVDDQDAATLASAQTYADNKVAALDATVDSTGGSHVAVKVVEEDGKVKTVTVTESNFDYEHITGANNKTLKETLEDRDAVVAASLNELDGRLDKAVQASVIVEDGENVLVLGAIS